ncbi:PepSY domain-containing protein [Phyllobacterium sp. UNC302MFCol5.2]|uniref:PepSY domain-containing protein n=1 Tax=Phyllobacterium sp. UNC302MFCol5.2 TaxID=1449065 RepID=UPI000480CFA8|nr:PepSY domain-containing protein [Phyllobacterium sp. UNC302MFCol5.2]
MRKLLIIGATALVAITSAPQAFAQSIVIGPDGVRLAEPQREPAYRSREISERDAVRIARSEGVRDVDDVRRRGSRFVVEGIDRRGDDIRVDIDLRTGDVVAVR